MEKLNYFENITDQQEKEAVNFIEWVFDLWYKQFDEFKKQNSWRWQLLLNWCIIGKKYPKYWEKRQKEFVQPDREKRRNENESKYKKDMSIATNKFIKEHMINECDFKNVKYKIIHESEDSVHIAIPFTAQNIATAKFGGWIIVYKNDCPKFFEEILTNYKKYDWNVELYSNSTKYNHWFI